MNYSTELREFCQTLANGSSITKFYTTPVKYANTRKKYSSIFEEFESINFPETLSLHEKVKWITDGITSIPRCPSCNSPLKISTTTGKYPLFCNQKCYIQSLKKDNPSAKRIIVNGKAFNSIAAACSELNVSYYKMIELLLDVNEPNCKFADDHDLQIDNILSTLKERNALLGDKEWILREKENHTPMYEMAQKLNVRYDDLKQAFLIHGISQVYDQISTYAKNKLTDYDWLKQNIELNSVVNIASELNVSVSSVHKACNKLNITIPRKQCSAGHAKLTLSL